MSPSRKKTPAAAAGQASRAARSRAGAAAGGAASRSGASAGPAAEAAAAGEVTFEDALDRLEAIVTRLEEGEVPLEESIQAYAEGTRLVRLCLSKLEAAEATIRDLSEKGGGFTLEPSVLEGAGEVAEDEDEEDGESEDEEEEDGELPF
jgi:exodeoxyribonuclease VII small subunit